MNGLLEEKPLMRVKNKAIPQVAANPIAKDSITAEALELLGYALRWMKTPNHG